MVESLQKTGPDQSQTRPRRGLLRTLRVLAAIVLPAALVFYVARSIWTQWGVIAARDWQFHWAWLLLSLVITWIDFILIVQLWRTVLGIVSGTPLRFAAAYRISAVSNLGKYLPGKVWAVMGMVYLLVQRGYSTPVALASTTLHQAFTVIAGAILIAVTLGASFWSRLPILPVALGLGVSVVILYPPMFTRLMNWGLRLLKRDPIEFKMPFVKVIGLFASYLLAWVLYGAALWCLLPGLGLPSPGFWRTVGAFDAGYLIGFLAVFAPGGLGVRESIIMELLAPGMIAGIPALIAVVARLWMTLMEIVQLVPVMVWIKRNLGRLSSEWITRPFSSS